jgi:diacylglycerol kinase
MKIEDRGLKIENREGEAPGEPWSRLARQEPRPPEFQHDPRIGALRQNANGKRRLWRDKFRESLRGIKLGIRGHSSFFVHFFFAALVSATAIVLRCDPLEWCLLLGCIGLVLTAELFNSAVETIYHGLDESTQLRVRHCLDIAAGAVLLASITAAVIGAIVFLPKLAALLVHFFD